MSPLNDFRQFETRRDFFTRGKNLLGGTALASLLGEAMTRQASGGLASGPQFAPKAKRVIYLHMVGGPSQIDLFDHKPEMHKWYDKDLPESIRNDTSSSQELRCRRTHHLLPLVDLSVQIG